MSPLDHRCLLLLIKEGQTVPPVFNDEAVDAESLWHTELVRVGGYRVICGCFPLEADGVVGLKHNELQLNVISDERVPLALHLLLQINIELDVVFELIVLGVGAIFDRLRARARLTFLVMAEVGRSKHT